MKPYKVTTNPFKDCGYCDRIVVVDAFGQVVSSHQNDSEAERMRDRLNDAFNEGRLYEARGSNQTREIKKVVPDPVPPKDEWLRRGW